jgi:hypothetical protein
LKRAAALLAAAALAGCGSGGADDRAARAVPVRTDAVPGPELRRQLANSFQDGLGALAVMNQPRDDAAALGQDVPAGTITRVRCQEPERCTVSWETVGGKRRTVTYRVRAFQGGCLTASADPPLEDPYDATIGARSANPLNALVAGECS